MKSILRLGSDGEIHEEKIPLEIVRASADLADDPSGYFVAGSGKLLPLDVLVNTRTRPDGILNAVRLMRLAYLGEQPKRGPIDVRPIKAGRFIVIDGNSTVYVARAAGWATIPCTIAK